MICIQVLDAETRKPVPGCDVSYSKVSIWGGNASGITDSHGYVSWHTDPGEATVSVSYKGKTMKRRIHLDGNTVFYIGRYGNTAHYKIPYLRDFFRK